MKTEDSGAYRSSLDHAAKTFAASLAELRQRHTLSLQDIALCTGTPRWRIDQLATGQSLPAWDEAQLLAWLFKVPVSRLIRPLQRACASAPVPRPRESTAEIRARATARRNVGRSWSLQALATAHPSVFDVTLADWPAWLAPHLAESIETEAIILRINEGLLQDCVDTVRAQQSVDRSLQSLEHGLSGVLNVTLGIHSRLRALTVRHTLRVSTPHSIDVHNLAVGLDAAQSALKHPIHLLRVLRCDATCQPQEPPTPLSDLPPADANALLNILDDAIATLSGTANALHCLAATLDSTPTLNT